MFLPVLFTRFSQFLLVPNFLIVSLLPLFSAYRFLLLLSLPSPSIPPSPPVHLIPLHFFIHPFFSQPLQSFINLYGTLSSGSLRLSLDSSPFFFSLSLYFLSSFPSPSLPVVPFSSFTFLSGFPW
jgi:hypothetical protein